MMQDYKLEDKLMAEQNSTKLSNKIELLVNKIAEPKVLRIGLISFAIGLYIFTHYSDSKYAHFIREYVGLIFK